MSANIPNHLPKEKVEVQQCPATYEMESNQLARISHVPAGEQKA
jgi:hypothetical protein